MKRAAILALPIVALLAGCGSSSGNSTTNQTMTTTATTMPSSTGAAIVTAKPSRFGAILATGAKDTTVYAFLADTPTKSNCSSACAAVWPPVITSGNPKAIGSALASKLGTIKLANGTLQVTYDGHPLYRYVEDAANGDSFGQDLNSFGALWLVLKPSGQLVHQAA